MNSLDNVAIFLVKTVFDLYLFVLMVRLILAYAQANYFNPLVSFIIKMTQPLVAPLRRVVPNYRRIEFSTLILIIVFELIKISLLFLLTQGMPSLFMLLAVSLLETIKLLLQTFFYAILLQALMSWFQPGETPATQVLRLLTAPVLNPLRRVLPVVHGFDLAPIPALILLQLCIILLP